MKKRRQPPDAFSQALLDERLVPELGRKTRTLTHAMLKGAMEKMIYARIVIPSPYVPVRTKTPWMDAFREETEKLATHALHYDMHTSLLQRLRTK